MIVSAMVVLFPVRAGILDVAEAPQRRVGCGMVGEFCLERTQMNAWPDARSAE
jgi:hypothetical protein